MKNRILRKSWNWPTLLGQLQITTGQMGSATLTLDGATLCHHPAPITAAQAAQQHQTGCEEWDSFQLPTPPLQYWGQVIEVAF